MFLSIKELINPEGDCCEFYYGIGYSSAYY